MRPKVEMGHTGAEMLVVMRKFLKWGWSEGASSIS